MTEQKTITVIEDRPSLLVLSAVLSLGKQAYGINIQNTIANDYLEQLSLSTIYEILIDLIEQDRVSSEKIVQDELPGWRKLFKLVIPEGMIAWTPCSSFYPNIPSDWDKGKVFHVDGSIEETHGLENPLAWYQDAHADGTNIAAYGSLFERGTSEHKQE